MDIREKLKKKHNKKHNKVEEKEEDDLFGMLNKVNSILKSNPQMVKTVSKCVGDIMNNKELMETLTKEISSNITPEMADNVASSRSEN